MEKIEFEFDVSDSMDVESELFAVMVERASKDIQYAINNPWGEFRIKANGKVWGVQWQYVGLENTEYEDYEDEYGEVKFTPVGEWYWEYETPDFEVSCMWKESDE